MARKQGTIVKRGPDTYLVRLGVGKDEHGKRLYDSKTVKGTLKDAQAALSEMAQAVHTNTRVEKTAYTVKGWVAFCIDTKEQARAITPYTASGYRETANLYIYPSLGAFKLDQLTPYRVQTWLNDLNTRGLSASTVRSAYVLLHGSLKKAFAARYLTLIPTTGAELPGKSRKGKGKALSAEQAQKLIDVYADGQTRYSPWKAFWTFLLGTGLRPGEACALTWDDLKDNHVTVQRSLIWHKDGRMEIEAPKTDAGIRGFDLPKAVTVALKQHRVEQQKLMLRRGEAFERKNLVFPNEHGGYLHITTIRQAWKLGLKKAGLPRNIRLYDARHTCFTLLLEGGVHPKVVQERAGHSSFQVTMDAYSHVTKAMQDGANEVLDRALSR